MAKVKEIKKSTTLNGINYTVSAKGLFDNEVKKYLNSLIDNEISDISNKIKSDKINGNKISKLCDKFQKEQRRFIFTEKLKKFGISEIGPMNKFINDSRKIAFFGEQDNDKKILSAWYNMIYRCYDERTFARTSGAYYNVIICEEWFSFSYFYEWAFPLYKNGFTLDKDILGNNSICCENEYKVYSPSTCCFVPREINLLLIQKNKDFRCFPIGVSWHKENQKFLSEISANGRMVNLGYYDTPNDAHMAYISRKKELINDKAREAFCNGDIQYNVFKALINYNFCHI